MKTISFPFKALLGLALVGLSSARAEGPHLGMISAGGTGCPAGSYSAQISPDGRSLSLIFDEYVARADNGRHIDRKSCGIAIPISVPEGYSVAIATVGLEGWASLSSHARAVVSLETFFSGSRGPHVTKTLRGPFDRSFEINDELVSSAVVWSPCGQDVILRAQSSLVVYGDGESDAIAGIDSLSPALFHLRWRRCH